MLCWGRLIPPRFPWQPSDPQNPHLPPSLRFQAIKKLTELSLWVCIISNENYSGKTSELINFLLPEKRFILIMLVIKIFLMSLSTLFCIIYSTHYLFFDLCTFCFVFINVLCGISPFGSFGNELFSKTFSRKEADWTGSEQLYETETRREWKLWSRIKLIQIVWTPIRLLGKIISF